MGHAVEIVSGALISARVYEKTNHFFNSASILVYCKTRIEVNVRKQVCSGHSCVFMELLFF